MIETPRIAHLVVTGAGGYVGRRLVEMALARGQRVTALARTGANLPDGVRYQPWTLGDPLPTEALDSGLPRDAQALVHLAHDWRERTDGEGANLAGSRRLRDDARRLGLGRTVFVSSLSARPDALNAYGRAKWRIEQLFDAPRELSLRVGLVYGGPRTAMYGLLCRLVRVAPVLPMIEPGKPVQPIHRDEVARGILAGVDRPLAGWAALAGPTPMPFAVVLDTLSQRFEGRRLRTIPVPLRLALVGCAVVNRLPLPIRVDRERVLGLAGTRAVESRGDLTRLGADVLPLGEGLLHEPAARKARLREGRTLLRYVLRAEPGAALLRRYVRSLGGATPALLLPGAAFRAPGLLRFAEPLRPAGPLAVRLALATRLAEASPEGERALSGGRSTRLAGLFADALFEAVAMPVRLASGALRR